jgi:hypothetical protein
MPKRSYILIGLNMGPTVFYNLKVANCSPFLLKELNLSSLFFFYPSWFAHHFRIFFFGNLKGRDLLGALGIDGHTIPQLILRKLILRM